MDKVLKYSGNLSLFYMNNQTPLSPEMYTRLAPFFEMVTVSIGLEDYLSQYEVVGAYPDIVMIDVEDSWEEGINIIHQTLKINSHQMIVVLNTSYTVAQLLILMKLKITYSLNIPLKFDDLYRVAFDASKELYDKRLEESSNQMLHQRVTELDNSIQSSKYAQETKDEFFASISHEIRTPINAVIGLSHILLDANLEDKYNDYIEKIQTSGNLILHIVNDILDFSKIEAGKLQVENIEFNINTILENASTMVGFKAHEKDLDLTFDIEDSVPALLKGDPLRLSQVLINLLSNAVKFTSQGGVVLSAKLLPQSQGSDLLEFCVSDTGIGLSQAQIGTLFQSFTQASSTTARNYGGTGLGLTISKQLVELMGGSIHVKSTVDKGSQFIFTIATEALRSDLYTLSTHRIKNKKVLIVDKHSKSKASLERILHYFSYTIIETPSLSNLHSLMNTHDVDIIFMDKETLKDCNLSLFPKECHAKLILMHTQQEIKEDTLAEGIKVDAHLDKPFNPQRLVSTLLKIFGEEAQIVQEKKLQKTSLQSLVGSKILLVDDNKINQSVIQALLSDTGIEVLTADSGKEAIEISQKTSNLDLIFMDIEMPIMDGYETTKALKKLRRLDAIPVIAFSGNTRQEDKEKSKKAGMLAHLSKPINVNNFYRALLKFIPAKRSIQERLEDASDEFKALFGVGNFVKALNLNRLLLQELKEQEQTKINTSITHTLETIRENILRYEKVFLVLLGNYHKAFEKFFTIVTKLEAQETLSKKEEDILNLSNAIKMHQSLEIYSALLVDFCHTFRDSVSVLKERVKAFKFEEAIQLTFQIRREALALDVSFISNSIAPIVGIEKTQKRQLEESVENFTLLVKE